MHNDWSKDNKQTKKTNVSNESLITRGLSLGCQEHGVELDRCDIQSNPKTLCVHVLFSALKNTYMAYDKSTQRADTHTHGTQSTHTRSALECD